MNEKDYEIISLKTHIDNIQGENEILSKFKDDFAKLKSTTKNDKDNKKFYEGVKNQLNLLIQNNEKSDKVMENYDNQLNLIRKNTEEIKTLNKEQIEM